MAYLPLSGPSIHYILDRVKGSRSRVLKGLSTGDICYGYVSTPTSFRVSGGRQIPSDYVISINPDEARIINLIFDLKIKGLGYSAISKHLNKQAVPSTSRGSKISGKAVNWNASLVRKILTREKYIGRWQWGKTSRIRDPIRDKIVKMDNPTDRWIEHHEGKEISHDLVIVPLEKWSQVQNQIENTTSEYRATQSKASAMLAARSIGANSSHLLAGLLYCGECGSTLLQITGKGGGYYGCYMFHRKDSGRCGNKRTVNRKKVESAVLAFISKSITSDQHILLATKIANSILKQRMKEAPLEIETAKRKLIDLERNISGLLKFIVQHGDVSSSVKESLQDKEKERSYLLTRIKYLQAVNSEKLLMTTFAIKEKFEKLEAKLKSDTVIANAALRKILPKGLVCISLAETTKKNLNQNNSRWLLTGDLIVGMPEMDLQIDDQNQKIELIL